MSTSAISSASSLSSGLWAQLQQQQALRTAEQAEQSARVLQRKASVAQGEADRAVEKARSLKVESQQAQGSAQEARRSLSELDGLSQLQQQYTALQSRLEPTSRTASSTAPAVASNSTSTPTDGSASLGTVIDITV